MRIGDPHGSGAVKSHPLNGVGPQYVACRASKKPCKYGTAAHVWFVDDEAMRQYSELHRLEKEGATPPTGYKASHNAGEPLNAMPHAEYEREYERMSAEAEHAASGGMGKRRLRKDDGETADGGKWSGGRETVPSTERFPGPNDEIATPDPDFTGIDADAIGGMRGLSTGNAPDAPVADVAYGSPTTTMRQPRRLSPRAAATMRNGEGTQAELRELHGQLSSIAHDRSVAAVSDFTRHGYSPQVAGTYFNNAPLPGQYTPAGISREDTNDILGRPNGARYTAEFNGPNGRTATIEAEIHADDATRPIGNVRVSEWRTNPNGGRRLLSTRTY